MVDVLSQVIAPYPGAAPELELYPIQVRLLRYPVNNNTTTRPTNSANVFGGMVGGIGSMVYGTYYIYLHLFIC